MADNRSETALDGSPSSTYCLAFSPDGNALAAGGQDGNVRVWDTRSWSLTRVLRAHFGIVRSVAYSPDGKTLAAAGDDATITLRSTSSGQARQRISEPESVKLVTFSSDGRWIASLGRGEVRLYDSNLDGLGVSIGPDASGQKRPVHGLAFSPDSRVSPSCASPIDSNSGTRPVVNVLPQCKRLAI